MAFDTKIILYPNGSRRKETTIGKVHIPDLWDLICALKEGKVSSKEDQKLAADAIQEVWGLAGTLKEHLLNMPGEKKKKKDKSGSWGIKPRFPDGVVRDEYGSRY